MFPSSNCNNPFESFLKRPSSFPSDQNPNSKQDDPPFLFNFPSPFLDEHESPLNQIFFQNHHMGGSLYLSDQTVNNTDPTKKEATKCDIGSSSNLNSREGDREIPTGIGPQSRRRGLGVIPRRRAGKKDRHSKICTAQGIRDRRMRLSLQVARKFFDLQDMLGYDKASKTIEWLFTKSKKAIRELMINEQQKTTNISTSDAKSESFLSECEVVSEIVENISNRDVKESVVPAANAMPLTSINPCEKDERKTQSPASRPNTREAREKARARARCRTREKLMVKNLENSFQLFKPNPTDNENIQKLGYSNSPFEGVDQESNSSNQERVSSYEAAYNLLDQQLADVGTIEKFLANSSSSSTSWPLPDYHCSAAVSVNTDLSSNFMGFFGSWDFLNNDRTNSIYAVTNQLSLAGNPSSVFSATAEFP